MTLPKHIIVLGQKYSIKQKYDLYHNNTPVHGLVDFDKKLIIIDSEQSNDQKLITLLHEIGHAVVKESALGEAGLLDEIEEIFVEQMAKTIMANFKFKKMACPNQAKDRPSKAQPTRRKK